jgi:hypothetical protein
MPERSLPARRQDAQKALLPAAERQALQGERQVASHVKEELRAATRAAERPVVAERPVAAELEAAKPPASAPAQPRELEASAQGWEADRLRENR